MSKVSDLDFRWNSSVKFATNDDLTNVKLSYDFEEALRNEEFTS